MLKTGLKITGAATALLAFQFALASSALAAGCASANDAAALKTAVMQQQLMVAALQCRESSAYNRFVMTYRGELQASDATLKAFFVRRGGEHGEAGYDTFKTKAANLSALEQARNSRAFCADTRALFTAALNNRGSLMSFVESRAGDLGNICLESRPVMAKAEIKPVAKPEAAVRVADARPAEIAVGGVPPHRLPVLPYRAEAPDSDPVPARTADRADDRDTLRDEEEEVRPAYANADAYEAPPPRPRYYQIRDQDYERDDYAPRAYGPPPGWQQQGWRDYPAPPPRWYGRRDPYDRW